jgi:hypothetical protein
MKTRITAILMALTFGMQAQFEPFEQFLFRSMLTNLPEYDSAVIWFDTIHPQNLYGSFDYTFMPNGMIDTMHFNEQASGSDLYQFSGTTIGQKHTIEAFYNVPTGLLPYQRTTFELDANDKVEWIYQDDFDGASYQPYNRFEIRYLTNGKVDELVESQFDGSSYVASAETHYHYHNAQLDSVIRTDYVHTWANEKTVFLRNSNGEVTEMHLYSYDFMNGDFELSQKSKFLYHNGAIRYELVYQFDHIEGDFYLTEVHEYTRKHNSNLGKPTHHISNLSVYPNPFVNELKISGENLSHYALYTTRGVLVMEGKLPAKIDVSRLKAGNYLLQVFDKKNGVEIRKIVKG